MAKQSQENFSNTRCKTKRATETTLAIRINWRIRWTNGEKWKLWDKWSISTVIYWKVGMRMLILINILTKQCLNCQIRTKSCSGKNCLQLLSFISQKVFKILLLREFNTWLFNVCKNVNLNKESNWIQTFSWSVEELALPQLQTDFKGSWSNLTSMVMGQRWEYLLRTKEAKEEFQVGWVPRLWLRWEYLTSGLYQRKSTNSMEPFKFKRDSDYFIWFEYTNTFISWINKNKNKIE